SNVAVISGRTVRASAGRQCAESLDKAELRSAWHVVSDSSMRTVAKLQQKIMDSVLPDFLIGFGGGRSVDLAKMTAYKVGKPFLSVPTSASHDGISSPFVSIRGSEKPHSVKANAPIGVLADTLLMSQAPRRLLAGGCGDLVAKITAVKDWELARDDIGEYFGSYAANLAYMSARIILAESEKFKNKDRFSIRTIVEALISAGVAACIAGSSRPCSGSEHLFSHAVEYVASSDCGLHGERVGIGTIMMAKLHGLDWEKIVETLKNVGAPTKAKQIGLSEANVVKALVTAQSLRPDRYTILSKVKLDKKSARDLAKSVRVI
ncbi:MAG: sn-glycerol-1-phosphate dehydrogenase, partial [Nitrososphaera sp.]|nr:sn-glycerol-1-phosphate dehydrogenase [Nitrososphaera sp.]